MAIIKFYSLLKDECLTWSILDSCKRNVQKASFWLPSIYPLRTRWRVLSKGLKAKRCESVSRRVESSSLVVSIS